MTARGFSRTRRWKPTWPSPASRSRPSARDSSDYDNDGWLDLFAANGEVRTIETLARRGDPYPLHQPNQLFRNLGDGRFQEVTGEAGSVFRLSEVSRGAAFGDVDNDGDTDVLLFNNNGRTRLLINRVGTANRWLGLRFVGRESNRDALGTWVGVFRKGKPTLWRRVRTDGSYASSNDPRVLVGLGDTPEVTRVRAHWPSGLMEEWPEIEPGAAMSRSGKGPGRRRECRHADPVIREGTVLSLIPRLVPPSPNCPVSLRRSRTPTALAGFLGGAVVSSLLGIAGVRRMQRTNSPGHRSS